MITLQIKVLYQSLRLIIYFNKYKGNDDSETRLVLPIKSFKKKMLLFFTKKFNGQNSNFKMFNGQIFIKKKLIKKIVFFMLS